MKINKKVILLLLIVLGIGLLFIFNKKYDLETSVVSIKASDIGNSEGRGFIYKKVKGGYYILTNNHVIAGKKNITVNIGKEELSASRVGIDDYLDVAIIKINTKKNYKVFKFGKENGIKILNKENTYMEGSVLEEDLYPVFVNSNNDYTMKLLKTDIHIEDGYSGSPLLNNKNQVIGIVTLKDKEGNAYVNKYEEFKDYLSILEKEEAIERPSLGITMVNASEKEILKIYELHIENDGGVVAVTSTNEGLKVGDVIIEFDSNKVDNIAMLRYYLFKKAKNDRVKVKIIRNEQEIEEEIILL